MQLNYRIRKIVVCVAMAVCLVGCSTGAVDEETTTAIGENVGNDNKPGNNTVTVSPSNVEGMDISDMFSARDKEVGYDKSKAITITLNGSTATASSSLVKIDGSTIYLSKEGTYIISGTLDNGQIIIQATDKDKIGLVLDNVTISSSNSAPIYVKEADKVFVTTTEDSKNTLKTTGEFVSDGEINVDAVIFSKADITLNGKGTLTIDTDYGHGIVSKDDLVITSGTYEINSSSHCIDGKDSVRIAEGTFKLTTEKDGIHSENKDDTTKGFIYIAAGEYEIDAADDGISSTAAVQIDGGNILMNTGKEGIEGYSVNILGGNINVVSGDDGINASGGREGDGSMYVNFAGGVTNINSGGDGIDSNGNFYISSGEVYILGPTNSANGALDYDGEGKITGGTFLAVGASMMAQSFSSATQGVILVKVANVPAGNDLILKDNEGTVVFSHKVDKAYNSIVLSTANIKEAETYTLVTGGKETTIEMSSIIYGGQGGMGGGFGGGKPGGDKGDFGGGKDFGDGDFGGGRPGGRSDM